MSLIKVEPDTLPGQIHISLVNLLSIVTEKNAGLPSGHVDATSV